VIPEVELPGHATAAIQAMKIRHQNSSPGDGRHCYTVHIYILALYMIAGYNVACAMCSFHIKSVGICSTEISYNFAFLNKTQKTSTF